MVLSIKSCFCKLMKFSSINKHKYFAKKIINLNQQFFFNSDLGFAWNLIVINKLRFSKVRDSSLTSMHFEFVDMNSTHNLEI